MIAAIPSLSVDGYLTNKHTMMMKLFEYFLSTDYSQSNTFMFKIASFKYIINIHKDPTDVKRLIISTLSDMYLRYYQQVTVNVTIATDTSSVRYHIDITATEGDDVYDLSYSIVNKNGILRSYDENQELLYDGGMVNNE